MKYHISENGPKPCKAKVKDCPYGQRGEAHYETQQEAYQAFESKLKNEYGALGVKKAKRINRSAIQRFYRQQDKINSNHPVSQSWAKVQAARSIQKTMTGHRNSLPYKKRRKKNLAQKFIQKQNRKMVRALTPNSRKVKKLMMTKYWMPDIHSNKWK